MRTIFCAMAIAAMLTPSASADIVINTLNFTQASGGPTVSNTDLAQTAVANPPTDITVITSASDAFDTRFLEMFNGAAGDGSQNTSTVDYVRIRDGHGVTVNFDTSVNNLGYDITGIDTIFNWNDRSGHGFSVNLGFVGGATGTLLADGFWADQDPEGSTTHYTVGELRNGSGGALTNDTFTFNNATTAGTGVTATGVESITIIFSNLDNPSVAGEIDIFGVPTTAVVPEPSSLAFLGLGALGFISRRRR